MHVYWSYVYDITVQEFKSAEIENIVVKYKSSHVFGSNNYGCIGKVSTQSAWKMFDNTVDWE